METQLRPLTLGEILDRTAQLYRSNFLVFAGIFSIYAGVALVLNLAQIGLGALSHDPQAARFSLLWFVVVAVEWVILVLLLGAAVAAINRAVGWVHLGEPASIRSAYAATLPRFGRYLWLMTITGATAWLPMALVYGGYTVFVVLRLHLGAGPPQPRSGDMQQAILFLSVTMAFFLLVGLTFVYGMIMTVRYSLALPACVVEDVKAGQAIRRSIELSKGARGRIFVLFLLVGVIKLGLVGITQSFFLVLVFKNHGQVAPWVSAISQVVAFFTNTFIGPIGAAGVALFYYDQRVRKEGYDIERMMQAAGWTVCAPVAPVAEADQTASAALPQPEFPAAPAAEAQGSHGWDATSS